MVGVHVDVDGMGGLVQLLSCSRSGLSEGGLRSLDCRESRLQPIQQPEGSNGNEQAFVKFVQAINEPEQRRLEESF